MPQRHLASWRRTAIIDTLVTALVVALALVAVPTQQQPAAAAVDCELPAAKVEAELLDLLEDERADAGLPALTPDEDLMALARDWSRTMADSGRFSHRPDHWTAYPSRLKGGGENIVASSDDARAARRLHTLWATSPGHLKNMLGKDHTHVGVGVACNADGRMYATQNFATGEGAAVTKATTPSPKTATPEASPPSGPATLRSACGGTPATSRFRDVGVDSTHGPAIVCMRRWGVASGFGDGTYRPGTTATRAQFAASLHRLLEHAGEAPRSTSTGRFRDVSEHEPAAAAINALAGAGIINGVDARRFAPDRPVTRGQMASLVSAAHESVFGRTFAVPPGHGGPRDIRGTTHERAIRGFEASGIALGYPDGTYRPDDPMTRGQLATFHARYADLLVRDGMADAPGA